MKRVIRASGQLGFTADEKQQLELLCEDVLYQLYENGTAEDDVSMEDIAEMVFEHVQVVLTEVAPKEYSPELVRDVTNPVGRVAKFARNYTFHHFDDYDWYLD